MDAARSERFWLMWLASVGLSFAALERAAYQGRRHPTLSRCLARWLHCSPHHQHRYAGPTLLAAGGAFLAWHVVTLPELESRRVE